MSHHGIGTDLIAQVFDRADAFFAMPQEEKARVAIDAGNRGWAAEGSETLDPDSGQVDRKEAFNMSLRELQAACARISRLCRTWACR